VSDVIRLEHGVVIGGGKGAQLVACVEERQKLPPFGTRVACQEGLDLVDFRSNTRQSGATGRRSPIQAARFPLGAR
jgi:hypothetical protein